MPRFAVEAYATHLVWSEREGFADRARAAVRETRVRYLGSLFVPEDEICLHLFEGPSAASVGTVCTRAGFSFERIVETLAWPASVDAAG